jgi:hypothetical protein
LKAATRQLLAIPPQVKLSNLITAILDQGGLGSCAANAVTQALHAAHTREGVAEAPFTSRLRLYRYARVILGDPTADSGTSLRACFDVIRKLGFCAEDAWTYDDGPEKFKLLPPAEAEREAHDQLGDIGYYRIDSVGEQRCEDVRAAVAAGYVVAFGTQLSSRFAGYTAGSLPLDPPAPGDPILGGHALCVAGYGTGYFDIVNSWGPGWGDRGWCQFTDAYIADARSTDFWIVEGAPLYSE